MSLTNLANHLKDTGDRTGALAAATRAVDIFQRLAAANPTQFEPDLAVSLTSLTGLLSETGDETGALAAATRVVEIYERLTPSHPARFEPLLADGLQNLSRSEGPVERDRRRDWSTRGSHASGRNL